MSVLLRTIEGPRTDDRHGRAPLETRVTKSVAFVGGTDPTMALERFAGPAAVADPAFGRNCRRLA
jgi:hypothetical protein